MKEITRERIVKDTIYVAIDGTEFETKDKCRAHENDYLNECVTIFDGFGNVIDFPTDDFDDVYGIVFHKTDEEFVTDFLNTFAYDDKTFNELSNEELFYENKNNQIVLIFSDTEIRWINPIYRIQKYIEEATYITEVRDIALE